MDLEYAVHWLLTGGRTNGTSGRLSHIYCHITMMILQFRGIFAFQTQLKDRDFTMKSRRTWWLLHEARLARKHKHRWTIQTPPAANFSINFNIKTSCQSLCEKKRTRAFKSYKVPREAEAGIVPWAAQTAYREPCSVTLPKPCFCVLRLNLTTERKKKAALREDVGCKVGSA